MNIIQLFLIFIMNLPQQFNEQMQLQLGDNCRLFLESLEQISPTSIRVNPRKWLTRNYTPIGWTEFGYYLPNRPSFTLDPLFHAGCYYVQEASSMLLEQAVKQSMDLSQPIIALDLCAAPGGKSTHLLSSLNDRSLLVSNEVIRSRANVLSENIQKWGLGNVVVTHNDPQDFAELEGFFDLMVVDAPCSGEGLFRKDPSAVNEWSKQSIELCAQRQQRILADVWPALKENGILIYSTCTYNTIENEQNLLWLASRHDVEFISLRLDATWGVQESCESNAIGYRCYPHLLRGEGFFLSVIRKKDPQPRCNFRTKIHLPLASKKVTQQLADWLVGERQELIQLNDLVIAIPASLLDTINFLAQKLNMVLRGTAIATEKHTKLVPEHALALSVLLNRQHFRQVELSADEALTYLRKDTLNIGGDSKGFGLVTYFERPLGWVNLLGNRINNLYPSTWRILKK
jgi:16S rRNA C967 or C1407 C5-methylase (RsmB/RsmF family)/NOL1/NOP2/fmu family ribosome biogenesis protein